MDSLNGKNQIKREINRIEKFVLYTKEYIIKCKRIKRINFSIKYKLKDDISESEKHKKDLIKRLTCKHINQSKHIYESHHNGDVDTTVYCTDCKLILKQYRY